MCCIYAGMFILNFVVAESQYYILLELANSHRSPSAILLARSWIIWGKSRRAAIVFIAICALGLAVVIGIETRFNQTLKCKHLLCCEWSFHSPVGGPSDDIPKYPAPKTALRYIITPIHSPEAYPTETEYRLDVPVYRARPSLSSILWSSCAPRSVGTYLRYSILCPNVGWQSS